MVHIQIDAFADSIVENIRNPEACDCDHVNATLQVPSSNTLTGTQGLTFHYCAKLMMLLLRRAHSMLHQPVDEHAFAAAVSSAVAEFAEPFPEELVHCYPHYLLHGICKPTVDEVANTILNNARVIHETLTKRVSFKESQLIFLHSHLHHPQYLKYLIFFFFYVNI